MNSLFLPITHLRESTALAYINHVVIISEWKVQLQHCALSPHPVTSQETGMQAYTVVVRTLAIVSSPSLGTGRTSLALLGVTLRLINSATSVIRDGICLMYSRVPIHTSLTVLTFHNYHPPVQVH
jgi:hypothetical protein